MIRILENRNFPISQLVPLASERSIGMSVTFHGEQIPVQVLTEPSFKGIDFALFSAGGSISAKFVPAAVANGAICIDNTSHFRMDPTVPLVVPEVNGSILKSSDKIIANPNCSTAQMVMLLKPIHDAAKIKRVIVSTYQSVSGAGKEGIDELERESKATLSGRAFVNKKFTRSIAFNLIPHIDVFMNNRYTKEEMKLILETQKILGDDSIQITATAVRVPVFVGHSESINVETERHISVDALIKLFENTKGVTVMDDPKNALYPTPKETAGQDDVFVGRIREDFSRPNCINLWCVGDNLRKGAALNAVQIVEYIVKNGIFAH